MSTKSLTDTLKLGRLFKGQHEYVVRHSKKLDWVLQCSSPIATKPPCHLAHRHVAQGQVQNREMLLPPLCLVYVVFVYVASVVLLLSFVLSCLKSFYLIVWHSCTNKFKPSRSIYTFYIYLCGETCSVATRSSSSKSWSRLFFFFLMGVLAPSSRLQFNTIVL